MVAEGEYDCIVTAAEGPLYTRAKGTKYYRLTFNNEVVPTLQLVRIAHFDVYLHVWKKRHNLPWIRFAYGEVLPEFQPPEDPSWLLDMKMSVRVKLRPWQRTDGSTVMIPTSDLLWKSIEPAD